MAEVLKPWSMRPCDQCGFEFYASRQFQVVLEDGVPLLCDHCDGYRRGVSDVEKGNSRLARAEKVIAAARGCIEDYRSPCGVEGTSNGRICSYCEVVPRLCGCAAGVLRRALEEYEEARAAESEGG